MMKKSWFFLDDTAKLAFAAAVGTKLAAYVDDVEMMDENHMGRRWATAICHILDERYDRLTEEELGWLVKGMLGDMFRETFWGHVALIDARVIRRNDSEIRIAYCVALFE